MAKKRPVYTRKQNIIADLIEEYDIETADDMQDALKDLLGDTIQNMMETELYNHLGYEPYERSSESNARNEKKKKTVRSKYGEISLNVPQDRDSSFEPKVVKKRRKDILHIDSKIIAMYAKGMSTRKISEQIEDNYGFEVSEGMVSDVTIKLECHYANIQIFSRCPESHLYH
jgi:transposase-like protein